MSIISKTITFFFCIAIPSFNFGQIVLNASDLPQIGDLQISVKVDSTQGAMLQPGSEGDNIIWDFSNLIPCCGSIEKSYDTLLWEDHIITPNASSFPVSDIVWKNRCTTFHSHVTHQDETSCFYEHYFRNDSGLWHYGTEEPANIVFQSPWIVFPLLSYGDTLVSSARIVSPLSADSILVRTISTIAVCNGWGTVITPDTAAEVARVNSTETVIDSLFVNSSLQESSTMTGNYYYRWYTKELGYPLLEINRGLLNQGSPFYQKVRYATKPANIPSIIKEWELTENSEVLLTPNPFSNGLVLHPVRKKDIVLLRIYDVNGKIMVKMDNPGNEMSFISTGNFTDEIYFYKVASGNNNNTGGILLMQKSSE